MKVENHWYKQFKGAFHNHTPPGDFLPSASLVLPLDSIAIVQEENQGQTSNENCAFI